MNDQNKTIKLILNDIEAHGVLQAIGDGISIQDTNYKILYQNSKHKSLIGEHIGEYCYEDPKFRKEIKKRVLDDCSSGD
jgi:hypothetical protein